MMAIENIKYNLKINRQQYQHSGSTLGLGFILNTLVDSNIFNVSFHEETLNTIRGEKATIIYFNNKKIYLDFWEYQSPTHSKAVYDHNFDLIIKLQHRNISTDQYIKACQRKKIFTFLSNEQKVNFLSKITPWTFFGSRLLNNFIKKGHDFYNSPINQLCFFCGKNWKCRHQILNQLKKQNIECILSDQGEFNGKAISDEEYLLKMTTSKYGLVLAGRSTHFTDSKNRREIDYLFLKKPLIMNYKPNYFNDFIEGKHYIYINDETKICELEGKYNLQSIVDEGYRWYLDNASHDGIVKSFLKIMKKNCFL